MRDVQQGDADAARDRGGRHDAAAQQQVPGTTGAGVRPPAPGRAVPPLRPAQLLAIQRLAGNRAATLAVQRDPPTQAPDKVDLTAITASGTVDISGSAEASRSQLKDAFGKPLLDAAGQPMTAVVAKSPKMSASSSVGTTVSQPQAVEVGFVQTLQESTRTAIYGRNGKEMFRQTHGAGTARDARPLGNNTGRGAGETSPSRWPWYDESTGVTTVKDPGAATRISTKDQASHPVEPQLNGADLMGMDGREDFRLSVAAKEFGKNDVHHIGGSGSTWGFSWAMTIAPDMTGTGTPAEAAKSLPPDVGAQVLPEDTPIAKNAGAFWIDFRSLAEAMAAPVPLLLTNVGMTAQAGARATAARGFTLDAIRQRNPTVALRVGVTETSSWVGDDRLRVKLSGTKEVTRSIRAGTKSPGSVQVGVMDLFGDPAEIGTTPVTAEISVESDWIGSTPGRASWPTLPAMVTPRTVETGSVDAGTYVLSASL